ncbi:endo-beta-1 [Pyricularia oryzae]|uniref:glucan endo-1,3-beta-D-glucosidase n=2 Tax=Pyricularia oryzae TaxID=318829 RepID=A0AA97P2L7_PYRO3|nr:endo-beta-1,3-glucanase [Pyricularia oryzae Y34]KAI7915954.1 endo-beta-1 [Pyricularia oryzae]KAI7918427.1 endo-beta-1 [Pyricularia oryzae]
MQRHNRYEVDPAEREPLDYSGDSHFQSQPPATTHYDDRSQYHQQQQPQQQNHRHHHQQQEDYYDQEHTRDRYDDSGNHRQSPSPPRGAAGTYRPDADFDASLDRLRADRRNDRDRHHWPGAASPNPDIVSPLSPPQPADSSYWGQEHGGRARPPKSNVTPGADNFSASAGGGMAGIAYQVADRNARESGLEAMRGTDPDQPNFPEQAYHGAQNGQSQNGDFGPQSPFPSDGPRQRGYGHDAGDRDSHSSLTGLGASGIPPGRSTPGNVTPSRSPLSRSGVYTDDPYSGFSRSSLPNLGVVNPHDIFDDGDDGLDYGRRNHRTSMLSLGASSNRSGSNLGAAAAGAGAGRAGSGSRAATYGPVNSNSPYEETHNLGAEKNWGEKPKGKSKVWRLVVIGIVAVAIIAALALGIVFGVVLKDGGGGGVVNPGQTAQEDQAANGDLTADSKEIKSLMSNNQLHRVFMGMDYTPLNTQYPDCLKFPPSQNNVTRDIAVLSKLTNIVRTYGTDCNQTEMIITAIDRLKLKGKMKMWLGVWQDKNETTNARQLGEMWNTLDHHSKDGRKPEDYFKGLIVANEILYRKEMTSSQLQLLLSNVRANLTTKGINLPVATSDLGDDWRNKDLADASDYIMANIHPFFGGTPADKAATWTKEFYNNWVKPNEKTQTDRNVIAEYGWPSQGGQRCPVDDPNCLKPAVADVKELNKVLEDWVCPALNNGTNYFWFSAFDEPWKIRFNTAKENWEDHWGLMTVDRQLKSGITIPDCGGKEAPAA